MVPRRRLLAWTAAALLPASCDVDATAPPTPRRTPTPTTSTAQPTGSGSPGTAHSPAGSPAALLLPAGPPEVIASDLKNPWSLVFVDGRPMFSQRGRATISTIVDGEVAVVLHVPEVVAAAEGGLLGLAVSHADPGHLYAYYTAATDNRVVRYPVVQIDGLVSLGEPDVILDGIPKARGHNGGRLAFGPDSKLYISTGDAGERSRSQDLDSLGGKILRLNPDGSVPADNPFDSPVWSYGHRNVQGMAWDDRGRMWATEFGQDTWDELNIITPGGNYGWPVAEGMSDDDDFVQPVLVWRPEEASPSGLLFRDGNLYAASLRGQRLWAMLASDPAGTATASLVGDPGRLRDVVAAPDGTIWVLTSNNSDDVILSYRLAPA